MDLLNQRENKASNIRKVIRNATKDMSVWSNEDITKTRTRWFDNTIKNSDELINDSKTEQNKADLTKYVKNTAQNNNLQTQKKPQNSIVEDRKNRAGINKVETRKYNDNIWYTNGSVFEWVNSGKISDITLENRRNANVSRLNAGDYIDEKTKNSEKMWKAINDLYNVTYKVLDNGQDIEFEKIRERFPEFDNLEDGVLQSMINDVKWLVQKWDMDLKKISESYPELWYISSIDLGFQWKAELVNNLIDWDESGLLNWVNDKLGLNALSNKLTGKSVLENLDYWSDWAYDQKKTAITDNELEREFDKQLQEKYKDYINEDGTFTQEAIEKWINKEYNKEQKAYRNEWLTRMVGNFLKWVPMYINLWAQILNHPEVLAQLWQMIYGAWVKGVEKLERPLLDKMVQKDGYENWDEYKNVLEESVMNGSQQSKLVNKIVQSELIWDELVDYVKDTYWSMQNFLVALQERPEDVLSDIWDIAAGWVDLMRATNIISPNTAKLLKDSLQLVNPWDMWMKVAGGATLKLAKTEWKLAGKVIWKTMKWISGGKNLLENSFIGKWAEFIMNKLTNLTAEEREFIKNNYDIVQEYLNGNRTADEIWKMIVERMDELLENKKLTGEEYERLKNLGQKMPTNGLLDGVKKVFDEFGITIRDGNLVFSEFGLNDTQKSKIIKAWEVIQKWLQQWELSVTDILGIRQQLDDLIKYGPLDALSTADKNMQRAIKWLRAEVDKIAKMIPWMEQADNMYQWFINAIKEFKKDWFDKDGNLKENALSKIRNLTNKANEKKLERLEKYLPGITKALQGLAVAQSIERAGKAMVWQYAQQILTIWWLWRLLSWDLSLATALLGMAIMTPKNLSELLRMQWNFERRWRTIADKLDKWQILSNRDRDRLYRFLRDDEARIWEDIQELKKSKKWEEYNESEYQRWQGLAYGWESTEKKMTKEEKGKQLDKWWKKAKNLWFVMKIAKDLEEWVQGYTDLKEKLIKLIENPGDTTIQHEFFHALFSVVDDDTKKYILNEAKKFLNTASDEAAEEWLAESFAIYVRRKEIKLGEISLKGNRLQRFKAKLTDLFQRAYEWLQWYKVDRETINKLFDIAMDDDLKLWKDGWIDLFEKLWIENKSKGKKLGWVENKKWLRYKKGWHGGWDFDKFDLSHSREWEWSEAHWYGVYITENKDRAKEYANLYRNNKYGFYRGFGDAKQFVSYKGMKKPEIDWKYDYLVRKVIDGMMEKDDAYPYYDAESQIAKQKRAINNEKNVMMGRMSWEEFNNYKKEKDKELRFLDSLDPKDFKVEDTKRNLYEVDVPNKVKRDTPTWSNYLEEKGEIPMLARDDFAFAIDEKLGNEAYKWFLKELWRKRNLLWEDIYRALSKVLGSTKDASMFLKELGYDGIHYIWELDGSSYVLFNDKGLPIKDKIRYKKIWNKEVAINTKATSPSQLSEVNADGLSVMKAFISDKQAEKALWVNKALLDKDGNAYMWTHTNKYSDNVITDFKSTKDSKYKSFEDKDIAWFTNNEEMSKSYANWESTLANTKKVKTMDELNKFLDDNKHEYVVNIKDGTMTSYSKRHLIKTDEWYELIRETSDVTKQPIEAYYQDYNGMWGWYDLWEMPKDKNEALKKLQDYLDENDYQVTGTRKVKLLDDWNVEMTHKYEPSIYGIYDTLDQALKEWAGRWMPAGKYHYQWIIQDVKNPLVIEVKNQDGTKTYWSRLGTVDDIFKREWIDYNKNVDYYIRDVEEAMDGFSERMKAINEYWNNAYRDDPYNWISQLIWNIQLAANNGVSYMVDEVRNLIKDWLLDDNTKRWLKNKVYGDIAQYGETLEDVINELVDYIDTDRNYMALNMLSEEWIKKWIKNMWASNALQAVMSDKYWTDMLREWRDVWDKWWRENIRWQLTTNWMYLETNDWVKYALRKWDYDGVIFKNIYDYGGKAENMEKWWDVLAAFHSNQFKSWNNEAPTESKYIMYKKNIWLNKKEWKWLSRKDAEYEKAVKGWDMWKAMWLLRKEAESKWYNSSSDYQWSKAFNGSAPRSEWLTKEERVNWWDIYAQTLWDYASDWLDMWDLDWQLNDGLQLALRRRDEYDIESIRNLKKAVDEYRNWNKNAKIKMYRAIDGNIKEEWFRNWDWITPSRKYAEMHIGLQDWDKWKIIEEEVPIENIWWDNNDINEWWYDDGKEYGYKNTKNNKKLLEPTYDDNGKLIPLSKRFDEKKSDIRYKKWLERKNVWKKTNLLASEKNWKYFDNLGNEISRGAYRNINNYNKLLRKFRNAVKYNDYNAQYNLIEKLNWLAHRIKKQTKWNKTYEKNTYPLKNSFANRERQRRWNSAIKWDKDEEMYYIVRPDGKKWVHVADSVWKWIKKE